MLALGEDLYRILKAEAAAYNDRLQSLWLQKLTLSGALAAFFLLNGMAVARAAPVLPIYAGVALLFVLAVTIDLKVLEYGLHVRAISRFLARKYEGEPMVAEWEQVLWGEAPGPERPLVLARSGLTILSAAAPTLAVLAAATFVLSQGLADGRVETAGLVIGSGYVATMIIAVLTVFRKPSRR